MVLEIKLPELGENVDSGTVVKVFVSEGDEIQKEQGILELETDKAVLEVPSDVRGVVKEVLVKEGDQINVGQTILVLEGDAGGEGSRTPSEEGTKALEVKERQEARHEDRSSKRKMEEQVDKRIDEPQTKNRERIIDVKLPELGENIDSGTVTKVLVSVGEAVQPNQGLVELETDKAVLEVPSEAGGVVKKIFVEEGGELKVGGKILSLGVEGKEVKEPPEKKVTKPKVRPEVDKLKEKPSVGFLEAEEKRSRAREPREQRKFAPAAPSVRRFAREIGIDINEVPGSGPKGRISVEDVKQYSRRLHRQRAVPTPVVGIEPEELPDFSKWGAVERKPMSNVRLKTALHLGYAWATIPHVTQFDRADITEFENLRKQFAHQAEQAGGKLTVTAVLLKIATAGLKIFPQFNASVDMGKKEIIYKKYFHIGVAVDTDRGLLVPVIRDVDKKNIIQLSKELTEVAQKARNKKLSLEEMRGGNFTISNLGGIGGTAFTPVINSPEVAILGVSRSHMEQVYIDGQFEPRFILPLSLSYDHRLIDGADAARFLRWIAEAIEQPFKIVLEG